MWNYTIMFFLCTYLRVFPMSKRGHSSTTLQSILESALLHFQKQSSAVFLLAKATHICTRKLNETRTLTCEFTGAGWGSRWNTNQMPEDDKSVMQLYLYSRVLFPSFFLCSLFSHTSLALCSPSLPSPPLAGGAPSSEGKAALNGLDAVSPCIFNGRRPSRWNLAVNYA